MTDILTDLSTPALTEAIEGNIAALVAITRALPGASGAEEADLEWAISGAPFPNLNPVAGARFTPTNADARIEATLEPYKARGVPLLWYTGPGSQPADLGQHLLAHGFSHDSDDPGMAIDLRTLPEPTPLDAQVAIVRVRDLAALRTWAAVAAAGFEFPAGAETVIEPFLAVYSLDDAAPVRFYLATVDDAPAACSMLVLGGGVAGIYTVATMPNFRRRGLGAALTLAPLYDARALGYRAGVLEASEMGHPIYLRLGFHVCCTIGFYTWQPGEGTGG